MCLKGLGSIALPEDLSSLLGNIQGEIPAIPVTMHAHLKILSVFINKFVLITHCLYETHDETPKRPFIVTTSIFVKMPAVKSGTE